MNTSGDSSRPSAPASPEGVAIIGMSCLFAGAPDLDAYWRNILGKVDAVTDPPDGGPGAIGSYDPDATDPDRAYCQRGGYLGSMTTFDPLSHGIPPVAVGGEPDQWLALQLARDALADAGCLQSDEAVRRRTAVILGKGTYLNGGNAVVVQHRLVINQTLRILKELHPEYTEGQLDDLRAELKRSLPPFNPETMPGLIPNIIVGRIANRLDLMGPSYTVDAACASSLVAVQQAMRGLVDGEFDLAIAGGSQVWMPMPTVSIFCQLGALSRKQQIRPFDKGADGTLLGEGIGMLVLKRLRDAERDGDRIYAVIRGVGVASDGRGLSVMAPRVEGEELALRRAYEAAGVSPRTVGLIEAHGTGTPVGDLAEVQALGRVFGPREGERPRCALGSVKSMISHTIPAAGAAGIIKVALSLYQKVLPPTLHCDEPNPRLELEKTPFYVNTETRPWIHGGTEPRRAGVNAFGFGGINAHVVLEEHRPEPAGPGAAAAPDRRPDAASRDRDERELPDHLSGWDSEVCILGAESPSGLLDRARRLLRRLDDARGAGPGAMRLVDIAYTLGRELMTSGAATPYRLAVVAGSVADLREKLDRAARRLEAPGDCRQIRDASGIYFASQPLGREGRLAFLFPGEGSQYPNMMADLCLHFPEVRECFDEIDRVFFGHSRGYLLSDCVFAPPGFSEEERDRVRRQLSEMDLAIEGVLTANQALHSLLRGLGLCPDVIVGHSTGEFAAIRAAGILCLEPGGEERQLMLDLSRNYKDVAHRMGVPRAMLLAVGAARDKAEAIAREAGGEIFVAMDNCPHQVVLVGEKEAADRALAVVRREGLMHEYLSFDRAYHTHLFAPYTDHLKRIFARAPIQPPRIPIYSCTTAAPYPGDIEGIRELIVDHWVKPVEFRRTVEVLHDQGVRVFVEVGPRGNLSSFVEDILRGRRFCAVPANLQRRSGIMQLNHLVAQLTVHGLDLDLMYLYRRRRPREIDRDGEGGSAPPRPVHSRMELNTGFPPLRLSDGSSLQPRGDATASRPSPSPSPGPSSSLDPGIVVDGNETAPVPRAPAASAHAGGSMAQDFFRTIEEFLGDTQRGLRAGLVEGDGSMASPPGARADSPPDTDRSAIPFPLLGRLDPCTPGAELVARRTFDTAVDLYLRDHTLGRDVSDADPGLLALAVMPLTMSLEILAEAAAALAPGRIVVGLRDVRAHRWIAFDGEPQELEVTASLRPDDPDRAIVRLRNLTEDRRGSPPPASPVVEAAVLLAGSYPEPPRGGPPAPGDSRPSRLPPDRLYSDYMFHGPLWRGVESIDRVGEAGAVATLRVLPFDGLIRDVPDPRFVLDPAVLDAAGQVVGFWTAEQLATGRVIFPFRLEALDLYGYHRRPGEAVACLASIRLEGERLVRSDIEVVGEGGRPWIRLTGWEDRRFDLPPGLDPLMIPSRREISTPWTAPIEQVTGANPPYCRRVRADFAPDGGFWGRVWAYRVLGRAEREAFRQLDGPEARRLEWLAGRTAAKEAVAALVRARRGLDPPPPHIEIQAEDSGRLVAARAWLDPGDDPPVVSIGRVDGHIVAMAGLAPAPLLALAAVSDGPEATAIGRGMEAGAMERMAFVGPSWESELRSIDRERGE